MERAVSVIANALNSTKTNKEREALIEGLFSPNEIAEFAKRLAIVQLLKQGKPQHVIAKELGVGVATVGRGAKELKRGRFTTL